MYLYQSHDRDGPAAYSLICEYNQWRSGTAPIIIVDPNQYNGSDASRNHGGPVTGITTGNGASRNCLFNTPT